jgi:predicted dehydrogenase
MNPVKLGLIGLGEWPRQAYVPVLKQLDNVRVCAVAAPSSGTQEYAREQFGRQTAVYSDYRDLLQDVNVEAVTLALPNELHTEAMHDALASGKHMFYEPPIGHSEEGLRRTLSAMAASDRVIQADLELRYLPVMDAACRLVASGTIGDALMAKIRLWCDWGYGGGDWNQNPEQEGFFPWLSCWYFDVLDCVFEAPPLRASVVGGQAANGRLMDHGWATLEYPAGRIGQFEFNLVAPAGLEIRLSVLGTQGELEADLGSGQFRWRTAGTAWQEACHPASQPVHGFVGMWECLVDFLDAVGSNRAARADVEVARRVHAAMAACARAEAKKGTVPVDSLN